MIKYIGNFADWIQDEWITYLLNNSGTCFPVDATMEKEATILNDFNGVTPAGDKIEGMEELWDLDHVCCVTYKQHILPFKVDLPIDIQDSEYDWFFLKLTPGKVQPIHLDAAITGKEYAGGVAIPNTSVLRYWMPLQDYKRGHIFMYNDQNFTDYKKGDLFLHDGENVWHGAGNMGHVTRLSWNFEVYPK